MIGQSRLVGTIFVAAALVVATPMHADEWTDFHFSVDPVSPTDQDTFDLRAWRWFGDSGYDLQDQSITVTGNQIDLYILVRDYHLFPGGFFATVMTPVGAFVNDFGPLTAGEYQINAQMWKTDLPGLPGTLYDEAMFSFTVTETTVPQSLPGDFNGNGIVDLSDYTVWRNSIGLRGAGQAADGNRDEVVDDHDYAMWKAHFGEVAESGPAEGLAAAPEASALLLTLIGAAAVGVIRRR